MTITFGAVWIPIIITILGIAVPLLWPDNSSGWFTGIGTLFYLIPGLLVSLIAWVIYAVLK
jgi:hypothetical protein